MEKAFVNKKYKKIKGTKILEAKIRELETENGGTEEEIFTAALEAEILLQNGAGGVLVGICSDSDLEKPTKKTIIIILDDIVPIAEIDKGTLIDTCLANTQDDLLRGVKYVVPLLEHAVMLDYRFHNNIYAQGDITGLNFYFKK